MSSRTAPSPGGRRAAASFAVSPVPLCRRFGCCCGSGACCDPARPVDWAGAGSRRGLRVAAAAVPARASQLRSVERENSAFVKDSGGLSAVALVIVGLRGCCVGRMAPAKKIKALKHLICGFFPGMPLQNEDVGGPRPALRNQVLPQESSSSDFGLSGSRGGSRSSRNRFDRNAPLLAYIGHDHLATVRKTLFPISPGPKHGDYANNPVANLQRLRARALVPSNPDCDAYFIAVLLAMAQARFYSKSTGRRKSGWARRSGQTSLALSSSRRADTFHSPDELPLYEAEVERRRLDEERRYREYQPLRREEHRLRLCQLPSKSFDEDNKKRSRKSSHSSGGGGGDEPPSPSPSPFKRRRGASAAEVQSSMALTEQPEYGPLDELQGLWLGATSSAEVEVDDSDVKISAMIFKQAMCDHGHQRRFALLAVKRTPAYHSITPAYHSIETGRLKGNRLLSGNVCNQYI
ncbi:hypothetical protein GGTG_12143 [Gaeumannomyces tritici R3-111a-1]|uniref:Uncharacterized protein n=1 Tax=Gaeumannomyces tritici (strain R3-111a-1) TaxID=644352 RepID=J3PF64_GAET3|nr:hypothetical protein GGTG_12143 [Gaeumannomyces tritici R3-111a-1]EJT69966.1 hypothetical protein GGTG_12143 [Gaeumannomyces tritici R3-111a-1]